MLVMTTNAIPMLLWCPMCNKRHVDEGEFAMKEHHTHACQHCGAVWRPAIVATKGVRFLPGFQSEVRAPSAVSPDVPVEPGRHVHRFVNDLCRCGARDD